MNRLIRFYNQNKLEFWIMVIIIAFILFILQVLNGFAREDNRKRASQTNTANVSEAEKRNNEKVSEPIIEGNSLNNNQKNNNVDILDKFFNYCKINDFENAYNLLSTNCKKACFKNLDEFKEKYIKNKFSNNQKYDYELWSSRGYIIYRIKIYEDMLSTGVASNDYIEDYFTIIQENNETKLNIGGYINRVNINKTKTQNNINITVNYVDLYNGEYIYSVSIDNKSNNNIILDTRENATSTYIENSYGIQFPALLYENFANELQVKNGEEKNLNIKFNIDYRNDIKIESLVFSEVVLDNNNLNQRESFKIEL